MNIINVLVLDDKMLLVKDIIRDVKSVAPDATCVGFHRETEAILYAKHHSIDVALLDIDMPIMNGLLVAEKLCKIHPFLNIIFLTGYPEYALDSYTVYASDFLVKPLCREALAHAFNNLRHPIVQPHNGSYGVQALGANIKARRIKLGLSANDLAEHLDVSFQTVYRWESGERIPDTVMLVELSRILGVSINDLMTAGQ